MLKVKLRIRMEKKAGVKPWSESLKCNTQLRFYSLDNREHLKALEQGMTVSERPIWKHRENMH